MKALEVEDLHPMTFETYDDLIQHPPKLIGSTCDTRRLHSSLGCLSPTRFEDRLPRQLDFGQLGSLIGAG